MQNETYDLAGFSDDILKFVTLLGQPVIDMGCVGYLGGCTSAPILIHVTVQKPITTPIHTPLELAWVVNIPRENRANIGPPVVPNMVALICKQ